MYSNINMKKTIDGVEHNILPMDKYRELISENLKLKTHVEELTKPKLSTTSKEYHREYYKNNKDRLKTNASLKIPCPRCNKMIQKQHLSKHKLTQKCMLFDEIQKLKNAQHVK